jgi:type II secretory pathway predicted ATPase ExeA
MYEPFFGMDRRPFSATPDPGCFFGSAELQAVLEELTVCVERGQGIAILTAAAGIGKTLLCQKLAASLRERDGSRSQFETVYLSNSNFPTRRSLLQAILFEMGDEYSRRDEPELRLDLRSRLLSLRPEREALVLIVDEAHLFSDELLEELRTLSDLAADGSSLVRIVLSGQHDLEERLTDRAFDAINQRICTHVFVEPLTISESADYIRHRLVWAGCDVESTLSEEAIGIITRASGGVPRCLNQLSDHSLLLAFASDQKPVTADTVREALEDLKQLPLHWNDVSDGTEIVGFVEDENASETFDDESEESAIDDSAIDAERDAALSRLAGNDSVDNHDDEIPEPGSTNENAVDEAGIVESLRAAFEIASPADQSANATTLADGFEFDFSDSSDESDNESVGSDIDTAVEQGHSVADDRADPRAAGLPVDDGETQFQVQPSATQETILEAALTYDPASPRHDDADDEADGEDAGISFQLTSNGFELNDFGPPEELNSRACEVSPTDEQPVESGVIEFSFSKETESVDDEDSSSNEPNADDGDFVSESHVSNVDGSIAADDPTQGGRDTSSEPPTVSAAEITLALFGQDSVLPEHKVDAIMSALADSESVDLNGAAQSDRERTIATAETVSNEDGFVAEADKIERTSSHHKGPDTMNELVINESGYEEEFVYDPYAALQEPDGAGIVWNVSSFSRQFIAEEQAEFAEAVEDSAEVTAEDPVGDNFEFDEELILDNGDASEQECETAPASQQFMEEDFAIESVEQATESAEEFDTFRHESATLDHHSDAVAEVPGDEVADESATANESIEGVDQSEQIDDESVQSEPLVADDGLAAELAEGSIAEEAHEEQLRARTEHDVVQPVEDRPLQPSRLVDAVLPLLAELDEDLDSIVRPGTAGRSVLDIEAELIETTDQNSNELEDLIGKTMLDICLDTQSALQDSAAAIRNAEVAELKNFSDFDDTTDELPAEPFAAEPFDIVQPEPPRRDESSSYRLEARSADTSGRTLNDGAAPASPSPDEQVEKPFGRLFSDLRRRKG